MALTRWANDRYSPLVGWTRSKRRNIPEAALDGSGVVRTAWAIDYVRDLRRCGHFRRAEIGNDDAGNFKDTTRSGQQDNN